MTIFDLDSPLMNVLNKMADLMWLNILTLICCIPVITAGAALTSMHYVALKIVRNEESYITVQPGVGGTDHGSRSAGDLHFFICISGTCQI